uniref:Uncharacterized protein n=1 Tax=Tetradesmus obliquus TaxID=3088 RepID=A0A383WC25_TETOB|eukprot:jgi/Sobl393_1/11132/SZX74639.1
MLAAKLCAVARVLAPYSSDAAAAAVALAAAEAPATASTRRRRVPDGPGLEDFIAGSRFDNLPTTGQPGHPASSSSSSNGKSVLIETYGCQMNVSDSEIIGSVLAADSYSKAASVQEAGVVLLNTCAIRENAEARIWGRLGELQAEKRRRRASQQPPLLVGVLGCMAERLKARLLDSARLADLVVGPDAYRDLPRILAAVQAGEAQGSAAMNVQLSLEETYADIMPVRQDASRTSAFVSIMRGCNNMCAFCIVPFTRGRERSRPLDSILREVEALSEQGVKEITLLGQNVNSYADFSHLQQQQQHASSSQTDQHPQQHQAELQQQQQQQQAVLSYYAPGFASVYKPQRQGATGFGQLLEKVALVNPEMRVRFTSPHPKDFTEDVLGVISEHPNVCKYLHMPAQSGSSSMLQRMKRGYSREAYDGLVERARQVLPNVALSTDIIAGFCGETDEEHQATADLLRRTRYENAFIFAYSQRDKTYAARHLADDVPAEVKSQRLADLFAAYRQGQAELNQLEVGRIHLALLDGRPRRDGQHSLQGRSCSMKRVIIPEQPVPSSLRALQQHCAGLRLDPQQQQQQLYAGPLSSLGTGDYVAVLVQQVVGSSTLLSVPLARTSIQEFAAVLGGTIVSADEAPAWLVQQGAAAAAAAAASGGASDGESQQVLVAQG